MQCPYCLKNTTNFSLSANGTYQCPVCKTTAPRGFIESKSTPRAIVGVVGFSGHGKTVYLTSLFSALGNFSKYWQGFYFRSLDDYTHKILYERVPLFESGQLPESTPANFPNPAIIQYTNMPIYNSCFLVSYDTAGEVFNDAEQITRAGHYVAHSDVVLFILSISDCNKERLDDEMSRLLDSYVRAVYDHLKVDLKTKQKLIVILSKADLLKDLLSPTLYQWLLSGNINWYVIDIASKALEMDLMSMQIEDWLRESMNCSRFVNMARDNFIDVQYTLVSATGIDGSSQLEPFRVLDPFFWILKSAKTPYVEPKKELSFIEKTLNWFRKKPSSTVKEN